MVDLAMDPTAVNGGSSALDALWEASPMIASSSGTHMGNRFGAVAIRAVGLESPLTVVPTFKQYEDAAVVLGTTE